MRVLVIVLNFRHPEETLQCVQQVRESAYSNVDILIVDNASEADSTALSHPELRKENVLLSGGNIGYAAGNNVGIRYAIDRGFDAVCILNPDARVAPDLLQHLVATLQEDSSVGICGAAVQTSDRYMIRISLHPFRGFLPDKQYSQSLEDQPPCVETNYVEGCCMMLRCSMLEQIGLFDETFFLYFEEVELCLRASDHGWKAVNCLKAVVQHEEHAIPPKLKPYFIESVLLLARRRKNARIQSILRAACMTRGRPSCIRGLLRGLTKPLQLFPVAAVL